MFWDPVVQVEKGGSTSSDGLKEFCAKSFTDKSLVNQNTDIITQDGQMDLVKKKGVVNWARPFYPANKSSPPIILSKDYVTNILWGKFDS